MTQIRTRRWRVGAAVRILFTRDVTDSTNLGVITGHDGSFLTVRTSDGRWNVAVLPHEIVPAPLWFRIRASARRHEVAGLLGHRIVMLGLLIATLLGFVGMSQRVDDAAAQRATPEVCLGHPDENGYWNCSLGEFIVYPVLGQAGSVVLAEVLDL